MIPFNRLGWLFSRFGPMIYPGMVRREFCELLQTLPPHARLLDLGAGTGVLSHFAHQCRSDLQLAAADPAEGMLRYAPSHAKRVNAVAESLPFGDTHFDAVAIGESLHHFDAPGTALDEVTRVLKNEGALFIYDFDPATFMGALICRTERLLGEPANFFPPGRLAAMLEARGYRVGIARYGWRYTLIARLAELPKS
jgi:SAM-dependent methyltransferase